MFSFAGEEAGVEIVRHRGEGNRGLGEHSGSFRGQRQSVTRSYTSVTLGDARTHCSKYFFLIPFYLQAVHVHSANGGTLRKA
jgi:hypothetical protein